MMAVKKKTSEAESPVEVNITAGLTPLLTSAASICIFSLSEPGN